MSYGNTQLYDSHVETFLFNKNSEGIDICSQCDEKKRIICCNKCGEAICRSEKCSQLFPHYQDTIYAICTECSHDIGIKLKLVIDMSKLKLLKRKIKTRQTKQKI